MKILIDKVDKPPLIRVTTNQVKALFDQLPKEWTLPVKVVHVSGSLIESNSRCWSHDASFVGVSGKLTIFGRGLGIMDFIQPVLYALGRDALGISYNRRHQISHEDDKKLQKFIQPMTLHVKESLTAPSKSP